MEYELIPMRADLIDALADFYANLSEETFRTYNPYDAAGYGRETMAGIAERHAGGGEYHLLALADETVIGHGFLADCQGHYPQVGLVVADAARDQGVGRAILTALVEYGFGSLNAPCIGLNFNAENARARHLYESVGFRYRYERRTALGKRFPRQYRVAIFMRVCQPWGDMDTAMS